MENQIIPQWDQFPELSWKEKIAFLTYQFLQLPQTPCPVTHTWESGLYIREMVIPAQTLFLGRAHRLGHRCELVSGSLIQILPDKKILFDKPHEVTTEPGFHMVVFALTDVVGRTYHPNPLGITDTDLLEDSIFEPVADLERLGFQIAVNRNMYRNLEGAEALNA